MSRIDDEIRDGFGDDESIPAERDTDDMFFDDDGDGKERSDTLEIPTLDGIEREMLEIEDDGKSQARDEDDIFFPELLDDEDGQTGGGYSFDPRDEDELSIPSGDYPAEEPDIPIFSETAPRREAPKKKRYTFSFGFIVGMTVVIVVAALGVAIAMYAGYDFGFGVTPPVVSDTEKGQSSESEGEKQTEMPETEAKTDVGSDTQTGHETEVPAPTSDSLTVKSELASEGALVLVNKTHEYGFPDIDTVSLYSFKNDSYKISSSTIELEAATAEALNEMAAAFEAATGKHDLIVASGIRSYDDQLELYSARVEKYGIENAKKYVTEPGHSEHHTGLCFDLSIYTDEGVGMLISDSTEHGWVTEHCYEYGFVRRYEDEKADITGISEEDWHFRYVGRAHAYYMSANDLCLEEYIELVKKYSYESRLGFNEPTGTRYEVYFVPTASDEETEIPLPKEDGVTTEISGSNSGGFIVTVTYN